MDPNPEVIAFVKQTHQHKKAKQPWKVPVPHPDLLSTELTVPVGFSPLCCFMQSKEDELKISVSAKRMM